MKEYKKCWNQLRPTTQVFVTVGIIVICIFSWRTFDVGINSSFHIRQNFTSAFEARMSGNCHEFKKWVEDKYGNQWFDRCIKERERSDEKSPIVSFEIQQVSVNGNDAYILAKLTRADDPYSVNYQLHRKRWGLSSVWKINQSINK